ncbi:hypothetical protein RhiirA1_470750 [Rhizophagus irregularis]|uniref:Uncharacterized protein n=1 Tax=Rhizophagus irregularis TaxID=588596 RepID=A0A2N0R5K0_9GLOM|nr:hypothetical protein RhiirA1_470750 [Rhizophagus irregularis]
MNNHQEKIIVNNISDFEDFPIELLNPEFEQELSEIEPLREELNNDKDEEVSEIATELAYALINREGKQLNLMSAILCGKRHDEKLLKIKNIQDDSRHTIY